MRKRANIVRDIHRAFNRGDSFGALRFGQFSPSSGNMVSILLALRQCEAWQAGTMVFVCALLAAEDIERKVGFITYEIFIPIYGKSFSAQLVRKLLHRGLIEAAPFPDTFSHILRRKRVYRLSDKGRKCLRLFRDTYNSYQREVKRAKIKSLEQL